MAYISSSVWGGTQAIITTYHGADVHAWNPDCSWYRYGKEYGLNGCQHPGMDIGINHVSLYAKRGGKVIQAGFYEFYRPYHVTIQAENGDLDIYGHMWSISSSVTEGGRVEAGQYLGVSGEQTQRGTMIPDGSGPHLHFEVRRPNPSCSSGYEAIDPIGILTGETKVIPTNPFAIDDTIKVIDGPLNVRSGPGTDYGVAAILMVNNEMIVTAGPTNANGYAWYKIKTETAEGWVAGQFCNLIQAQGSGGTPPATYTHRITGSTLNLRTCASTGCSIITSLPIGTRLYIVSGPQQAEGYTWYQIQPEGYATGWSVNGFERV